MKNNLKLNFIKSLFFLGFLILGGLAFGQNKIDFSEIKKNIQDKDSPYYYDRLLFKYRGMPQSIDSTEAFHLYYGKKFTDHQLGEMNPNFSKLREKFQQRNFADAIKIGEDLHFKDPTNLEVLLILLQSYEQMKDQNKFVWTLQKFRMISATVLTSGKGDQEDSPYLVNSVGEEYVLLNLLKVPFQNYQRSSKMTKDGMMDIWTNGKEKIYINVVGHAPE
ncbi:DUF4919 domain-containing protein [Soonwooa sp.]|uniref:DUF4919 domain-containing protein n=1 Tax=Soonwooa sp. TaxID=1938592 RepID=UPI0026167087|nr:DUF4919 domain-containing protein [Soonwooa sp.]